jgi:hypothetical protein
MRKMRLCIVFAVAFFAGQASGTEFFSDKGSMWLGSGFSYFNLGTDTATDRLKLTCITPFFRYFFSRYVAAGPRFEWIGQSMEDQHVHKMGFGIDLAAVYSYRPTTFYVSCGTAFDRYVYHLSRPFPFGDIDTVKTGKSLSLNAGVIVTLKDIVSVQLEPGYDIVFISTGKGMNVNILRFSIGICSIGKSTAVSLLQVFPFPFWMFSL